MGKDTITQEEVSSMAKAAHNYWRLHFFVCVAVIGAGIAFNGGRKVVPAGPELTGPECRKSYINVFSSGVDAKDATICCPKSGYNGRPICNTDYLPGARRLSRYPDAWIIPLIPIMLRGIELLVQTLFTGKPAEKWTTYLIRFAFYYATLSFRGYVLYQFLNGMEDKLIPPPEDCWFKDLVKRAPSCRGIEFDFSDHTVLYLGSILPIPFMEAVHSLLMPLFKNNTWLNIKRVVLVGAMAYLYVIALGEEFKTATYYHSRAETVVGFMISLFVQLPYVALQSVTSLGWIRNLLFGIPTSFKHND